jgi:CBS-domain-containing membrane protein
MIMSLAREPTVTDAMAPPELQVSDHTAVDKALDVLGGAHVGYLLVRNDEGRCAGVVTAAQLDRYRSQTWYVQDTRIRDIAFTREPFARPELTAAVAAVVMRARGITAWPVVDSEGSAIGVVTPERIEAALRRDADILVNG